MADEFGQWRPKVNRFGDEHLDAYLRLVSKSFPEEDFEGRLDLHKLYESCMCGQEETVLTESRRFNTHVSALFHDDVAYRTQYEHVAWVLFPADATL